MSNNSDSNLRDCISCNGTGKIKCDCGTKNSPNATCFSCAGSGEFICPVCDGEGKF
ncbi:hypothetical protein JCM1393_26070 [Clostridium carnis]